MGMLSATLPQRSRPQHRAGVLVASPHLLSKTPHLTLLKHNPSLCRLGVVPALLKVLQTSRQPLLRAAVAAAFRHLARDGTMRSQLAEAGASVLFVRGGTRGWLASAGMPAALLDNHLPCDPALTP